MSSTMLCPVLSVSPSYLCLVSLCIVDSLVSLLTVYQSPFCITKYCLHFRLCFFTSLCHLSSTTPCFRSLYIPDHSVSPSIMCPFPFCFFERFKSPLTVSVPTVYPYPICVPIHSVSILSVSPLCSQPICAFHFPELYPLTVPSHSESQPTLYILR